MTKSFIPPLILALLILGATLSASPKAVRQSEVSSEEYAVYSALITEEYVKDKIKLVVITNPTSGGNRSKDMADYFLQQLSPLSQTTYDDYLERNRESYKLSNSFPLKEKYVLVEYGKVEKFFDNPDFDEAWKNFYKRYPASNGYIALSRVGFNPEKNQALVYMAWMCNSRCGEGKLVLMSKRDGKWKVEKHYTIWVS
jgi:hypothetical protein